MRNTLFIPVSQAGEIVAARVTALRTESLAKQRKTIFRDVDFIMKATGLVAKGSVITEVGIGAKADGVPGIIVCFERESTPVEPGASVGAVKVSGAG